MITIIDDLMRLTPSWPEHLHQIKEAEFDHVFGQISKKTFQSLLELGAGDGYQSLLLANVSHHVTSTEYQSPIVERPVHPFITYQVSDAECVDKQFSPKSFDCISSSNVLEHLTDPLRALRGIHTVLSDDGITIHLMPSVFWKLMYLFFYYPALIVRTLERLSPKDRVAKGVSIENNPKVHYARSRLLRVLFPPPHGVSKNHWTEFGAFRVVSWKKIFQEAGFRLIAVRRGPVASGHGFGMNMVRGLLERFGFASEYIYIAEKMDTPSLYAGLFRKEKRHGIDPL